MRISDWSSDVCSSDLHATFSTPPRRPRRHPGSGADPLAFAPFQTTGPLLEHTRAPTLHRAAPARLVGTGLAGGAAGARRRRMVRLALAAGAHAARAQRRNPGRGARERARTAHRRAAADRKSGVKGRSVSVRVATGGRRSCKKKKKKKTTHSTG